ncbi:hypothetical protein VIGAN_06166700, partial [Vigna angularis var. angularis]
AAGEEEVVGEGEALGDHVTGKQERIQRRTVQEGIACDKKCGFELKQFTRLYCTKCTKIKFRSVFLNYFLVQFSFFELLYS